MKKYLLIFSIFLFPNSTFSQSALAINGSPYLNTTAYCDKMLDVFSFVANPSFLARTSQFSVGLFSERRFLIEDLSYYFLAAVIPSGVGAFGFSINRFGNFAYNESQATIAYAKNLGNLDLGLRFNYYKVLIAGYGSSSIISPGLGTIWHITDKLHTDIDILNPIKSGNSNSGIHYLYSAGFGYEASPNVFIGTRIIKEEDKPVTIHPSINYQFANQLFARAGIVSGNLLPYFGAGWKWKSIRIDAAFSFHLQLGCSPSLMIIYEPPSATQQSKSD